ncbi:hypothetical protein EON63_20405 [archaeon]|nr:MAG: hypothetical protein EON63_20405 [archaeon]
MKVLKVVEDGMKAILCIGESRGEYEAGLNQQVCAMQLLKGLRGITPDQMQNVVLACKIHTNTNIRVALHTVHHTPYTIHLVSYRRARLGHRHGTNVSQRGRARSSPLHPHHTTQAVWPRHCTPNRHPVWGQREYTQCARAHGHAGYRRLSCGGSVFERRLLQ